MPIRITSKEINNNLKKFVKLFEYLKEKHIKYELVIETFDTLPFDTEEDLGGYV